MSMNRMFLALLGLVLFLTACGESVSEQECSEREECQTALDYYTLRVQYGAFEAQKMEKEGFKRHGGDERQAQNIETSNRFELSELKEVEGYGAVELILDDGRSAFAIRGEKIEEEGTTTLFFLMDNQEIIPLMDREAYDEAMSEETPVERIEYFSEGLSDQRRAEFLPDAKIPE